MKKPTYLIVTLKIMALYAGVMGALALFFHDAGSFVFSYTIADPMITRFWGGVLMAMAVMYLFISTDPVKYRLLLWAGVFDLSLATAVTVYHLSIGTISAVQGMVALFANPVLVVILLYGVAKEREGEVLFEAGAEKEAREGQELPAHIHGRHPLHRK